MGVGGCCGRAVNGEVAALSLSKLPQLFESEIFVLSLGGGDCCPVKLKVTAYFQNQRPDTVPLQIVGISGQGNWIPGKHPAASGWTLQCWLCTVFPVSAGMTVESRLELSLSPLCTAKKPISKTNRTRVSESYLLFLWMVAHTS